MAENKKLKIDWVGDFSGPHKNGKYENYTAYAKVSENGKSSDVIVQVGSEGMAKKFKAGETYEGKFVYKNEQEGKWLVAFMASDNPSLAEPKKEYSGGSGYKGGGGYSRDPDEGSMATACGILKSMIEAGFYSPETKTADILSELEAMFNGVKEIRNRNSQKQEPAKEEAPDKDKLAWELIKKHGLSKQFKEAHIERDDILKWYDLGEDRFIQNIKLALVPDVPSEDDDLPF